MTVCLQDKTLTGSIQPGALETLKNMMFKMQTMSTSAADADSNADITQLPAHTVLPPVSVHITKELHFVFTDSRLLQLDLDESLERLLSPETKQLLVQPDAQPPGDTGSESLAK